MSKNLWEMVAYACRGRTSCKTLKLKMYQRGRRRAKTHLLKRNAPEVSVTSEQNFYTNTEIIYIVLQTSVRLFKYLLKTEKLFQMNNTAKCREQKLEVIRNS